MLGRALIASVHAAAPRARALAPGGGRGLAGGVVGRARLLLNLIRGARGGRESDGGGRARREARRSGTLARLAKQRAAVLSVELNCGAERAQPAPRPHQPLRALQDACNPGGRARSSNPRGERCAPAARTSAARGRRRSPAAMRYTRLQLQCRACGRCERRCNGREVGTVGSLGSGWVSRDTMPASIIAISGFSTP